MHISAPFQVRQRLSNLAVPSKFVIAAVLPETHSGKFMRALLKKMLADTPLGDLGALKTPECVEPLAAACTFPEPSLNLP